MKKILTLALAVLLICTMAVPAFAATPELDVPDVPQVSKIEFKISLGDDFWDRYWETHPIKIPQIDWSGISFKFFS